MQELELENKDVPLKEVDLEFILEDNWDLVLDKLAQDLDPWNIDIVELANRYRDYLKKIKDYNLNVPARFILVCSILLRMKTDILLGKHQKQDAEFFDDFEDELVFEEEKSEYFIPEMHLPVRRAPVRRVTLEDLKQELSKALNIETSRKKRWGDRKADFGIHLKKSDIEEKLNKMMDTLKTMLNGNKSVDFEALLGEKNKQEVVEKFINILHLETNEKIKCTQKEFLGKILIKLKKDLETEKNG